MKLMFSNKSKGLLLLALSLYCLLPFFLFGSDFNFSNKVDGFVGALITYVTYSAGSQGFLVTLLVFGIMLLRLRLPAAKLVSVGVQLVILLGLSFAAKTYLKHWTESPRPYAVYLAEQQVVDLPEAFYELPLLAKNDAIVQVSSLVSDWRTIHWLGETDYSFPSGHMIFVGICVAFFGGLFWEARKFMWICALLVWAGAVAYSRVWLGMHRPIDLAASIGFAALLYALVPAIPHEKIEPYVPDWFKSFRAFN